MSLADNGMNNCQPAAPGSCIRSGAATQELAALIPGLKNLQEILGGIQYISELPATQAKGHAPEYHNCLLLTFPVILESATVYL